MANTQDKQITLSKKTLVAIILILLLLIAGGITVGLNWNNWFGDASDSNPGQTDGTWSPDIDENAGEYQGQKPTDQGGAAVGIKIPGYPSIPLVAGENTAYVSLLNPEGNPCYFVFNIVLKETGETLFTSKMVPPGKALNEVSLSQSFPKGEYPATIQISTYSLTDGSAMNGANVETVLKVN